MTGSGHRESGPSHQPDGHPDTRPCANGGNAKVAQLAERPGFSTGVERVRVTPFALITIHTGGPLMVTIFFDGLCEPNPDGVAAFGYAIHGLPGVAPVCGCGVLDGGVKGNTNNLAEWVALGKALAFLVATSAKVDELRILGDSQLVVNQLKGVWSCKEPRLVVMLERCRELLRAIGCPKDRVKAEWIPRGQNVQAGQLARAAYAGRVGKSPPEREKP